jgi:GH25 family lysozyme M1 (1,4-beta-N-acetylmuramidase)
MRFTLTALASILGTASVIASPARSSAPLHASEDASAHIPDAYIIRFKDDVAYGQIQAHTSMVEGLHGIDVSRWRDRSVV